MKGKTAFDDLVGSSLSNLSLGAGGQKAGQGMNRGSGISAPKGGPIGGDPLASLAGTEYPLEFTRNVCIGRY